MKLPPLNALKTFEAAARFGSFSRAGDELHVTYSAVSHQIRGLEQWLGRPLFERKSHGVELTKTGVALSNYFTPAFSGLAEICGRLRLNASQSTIAVGCIPSIASRWLVPRLTDFSAKHPDIAIQVLYAQAEQHLALGNLDVLITLGEDPSPHVKNTKLFSRVNRPVCSPHYLKRKDSFSTAQDMSKADLLHDETKEAWREWFKKAGLPDRGHAPGPVFQDFNMPATAVIAGHGIALCPVEVFRDEIRNGDLIVVSDIATLEDKGYFMITEKSATTEVQAFANWFADQVIKS